MPTSEARAREEHEEVIAPEIIALDFDRTLGSVEAAMQRFCLAAAQCGIETDAIQRQKASDEAIGTSFEPLSFIAQVCDAAGYHQFKDIYQSLLQPEILYPDVPEFLAQIKDIPHVVLTYGVNSDWQLLKVAASGYHGMQMVVSRPDKATYINGWKNQQAGYQIEEAGTGAMYAESASVCLIDDKVTAFQSLDADCSGFLLLRTDNGRSQPLAVLPLHVKIIHSLAELSVHNGRLVTAEG